MPAAKIILLLAIVSGAAGLCAWLHESGARPLKAILEFSRKLSLTGLFVFSLLAFPLIRLAAEKRGGDPAPAPARTPAGRTAVPLPPARPLTEEDFARGFVLHRVATNETFDFTAPSNAAVCAGWRASGAATDWIYADVKWKMEDGKGGTGDKTRLRIHSDGWVEMKDGPAFWPFKTILGIAPETNRPLASPFPSYTLHSQFWHGVTPSNTLRLTWRDALLNRDTNTPVSVQMELQPSGRFTYRYDLSCLDAEAVADALIGASFGDGGWTTNALPANVTSLSFYPLSEEDATTPDRDGDGLPLADELFVHGTDPDMPDTDLDGLPDGLEAALGTAPLLRDSDGDGLVDGSDPDPSIPTPPDDLDNDGIPDAYENHWFGSTTAVDSAEARAASGFTIGFQISAGIAPNAPLPFDAGTTNGVSALKLFDGFAADTPPGRTNVYERSFPVDTKGGWRQYFLSARPFAAGGWTLSGMRLEWEDSSGGRGCLPAGAPDDSFRIPLSATATNLTLRLVAEAGTVRAPRPLYLLGYEPSVILALDGIRTVELPGGRLLYIALHREEHEIRLEFDRSARPCAAPPDEAEGAAVPDTERSGFDGEPIVENGVTTAFRLSDRDPGVYPIGLLLDPPARRTDTPGDATARSALLAVLDPLFRPVPGGSAEAEWDAVSETWSVIERYPLDTACLRRKWKTHYLYTLPEGGEWGQSYEFAPFGIPVPSSPVEFSLGECVDEGRTWEVLADGRFCCLAAYPEIPVFSYEGWDSGSEILSKRDECGGCTPTGGCAGGDCDLLEGPELGSLKFRIPLGEPRAGIVSGFFWFRLEEPRTVTRDLFQLAMRDDASLRDTSENGIRTLSCFDGRGRTLSVSESERGVRIAVRETATGSLSHVWEIANPEGTPDAIRFRKLSRLGNTMSDETFSCADGVWERADNIAQTRETSESETLADEEGPLFRRHATLTDASGAVLSEHWTENRVIGGELRETARRERTASGWNVSSASYWEDAAHPARNGLPRLVAGTDRGWTYRDYDTSGRVTLEIAQLDGSPVPEGIDAPSARWRADLPPPGAVCSVREYGYETHDGDSGDIRDAALPRTVSTFAVRDGAPQMTARTWRVYTRSVTNGCPAVACRTVEAASPAASIDSPGNRVSEETSYPADSDSVPYPLRGRPLRSLDADGVETRWEYATGEWYPSTRTFTEGGAENALQTVVRRFRAGTDFPLYGVEIRDAFYGSLLCEEERLSSDDTPIRKTVRTYDEKGRLLSAAHPDGSSETNVYSCCRLLRSTGRDGAVTLRSARTGTDHLYHAMEEVSLTNLPSLSPSPVHKVTQRFYDALGRETNVVVTCVEEAGGAETPDCATVGPVAATVTEYPLGTPGYRLRVDPRGLRTVVASHSSSNAEETVTAEFPPEVPLDDLRDPGTAAALTNFLTRVTVTEFRNGGTATLRESGGLWSRETRTAIDEPDGTRRETVVTESCDRPVVTNSVTTFDFMGRILRDVSPLSVLDYRYDRTSGRALSVSNAITGEVTAYLYDALGEKTGEVKRDTLLASWTHYENRSNAVWQVESRARVTSSATNRTEETWTRLTGLSDTLRSQVLEFDSLGNRSERTVSFDAATQRMSVVQCLDRASPDVAVSMYGRVIERSGPDTHETTRFDPSGRGVSTSRSDAATGAWRSAVSNEYDTAGDILATVCEYAGGATTVETFLYDARGAETNRVDASGNTVATERDGGGRPLSETGQGSECPSRRSYDSAGRKTATATTRDGTVWDETLFLRDAASGLVTNTLYAGGDGMTQTYTPDGKPLNRSWSRWGRWTENVYDGAGRLAARCYADASLTPAVSIAYTDADLPGRVRDTDGTEYVYHYDASLSCTGETVTVAGKSFTLAHLSDGRGRPTFTSVSDPSSGSSSRRCDYDREGRPASVAMTDASGRTAIASYAYGGGFVTNLTVRLPGGGVLSLAVERDAGGRGLELRREYRFNGLPLRSAEYTRDARGRVTGTFDGAVSTAYAYDTRSRLSSVSAGADAWGYAYDEAGNRTAASRDGAAETYASDAANQYTRAGDDAPAYGPGGWLMEAGGLEYWFDDADRLAAVFDAATSRETLLRYDHRGRRVAAYSTAWSPGFDSCSTNAGRVLAWDGWTPVREWRAGADGAESVLDYYWGADLSGAVGGAGGVGGLLAVSLGGNFYIPLYDGCGNVVAYVSETGAVVAEYRYDSFGETLSQSGPLADAFPFRFSTKRLDAETGLYDYGLRHYKPSWGRWISRDPAGEDGGPNLYAFCGNDPVNHFDMFGAISLPNSVKKSLFEFISKNANIQGNVSKRLLHHYIFGNGVPFLLTHDEVKELGIFADLSKNKRFKRMYRLAKTTKIPKFNLSIKIQASTDLSGSLGAFGLDADLVVAVCPFEDRNRFQAHGTATIFDDWDFDWNLGKNIAAFFTGDVSRSTMGQIRTMLGSFIPGKPFSVHSNPFVIHQNSAESFLRYE